MILYAIFGTLVCSVFWLFSQLERPPPICGVYERPARWFSVKYALFYTILWLRKRGLLKTNATHMVTPEVEFAQELSAHPLAIDASYICGSDHNSGLFFGAGVQRRHSGRVESLLYLRVEGLGVLVWPKAPSSLMQENSPKSFSTDSGLTLTPETPMKSWRIQLNAEMKLQNDPEERKFVVKADFLWKSTAKEFNFDKDIDSSLMAEAIATEQWSKAYFNRLKDAHQTHYEQAGALEGSLEIVGFQKWDQLSMESVRDRSIGKFRDWSQIHRYILHHVFLRDGTVVVVHLISIPHVLMSHLITGFVSQNGRNFAINSCNKRLYEIGENSAPPSDYGIEVSADNGVTYSIRLSKKDSSKYYCGFGWETAIYHCFYDAKVNGVTAEAICEFAYRNRRGKSVD